MKPKLVELSALLERNLEPLVGYLRTPGLIELCINKPGEVWLETVGGWNRKRALELDIKTLKHLARTLATESGQEFSDHVPTLACFLPGYGYRVQIVSGALVDSGFAMAIRAGTARTFDLRSYFTAPIQTKGKKREKIEIVDGADKLRWAIETGKTIVVSGGTSTGKSSLLNGLLRLIPLDVRIITVEDTKELVVPHENSVRLLKSKTGTDIAKITHKDIINACMRLRPDRILVGELDVENTVPFLRLINTGHGGSMTTVHADSPKEAIDAICMNAQLAGLTGPVERYALQSINVIVQLERVARDKILAHVEYYGEGK